MSSGGAPHVSNFGKPFPAIQFWTVPELRAAWSHLIGPGHTTWSDWQILLYAAGRALLWVVVISAIFSMYGSFRPLFPEAVRREEPTRKTPRHRRERVRHSIAHRTHTSA